MRMMVGIQHLISTMASFLNTSSPSFRLRSILQSQNSHLAALKHRLSDELASDKMAAAAELIPQMLLLILVIEYTASGQASHHWHQAKLAMV